MQLKQERRGRSERKGRGKDTATAGGASPDPHANVVLQGGRRILTWLNAYHHGNGARISGGRCTSEDNDILAENNIDSAHKPAHNAFFCLFIQASL